MVFRLSQLQSLEDSIFSGMDIYRPNINRRPHVDRTHLYTHPEEILDMLYLVEDNFRTDEVSFIDIGCGYGLPVMAFAMHGIQAIGIDCSCHVIERAQEAASMFALPVDPEFHCMDYNNHDELQEVLRDYGGIRVAYSFPFDESMAQEAIECFRSDAFPTGSGLMLRHATEPRGLAWIDDILYRKI